MHNIDNSIAHARARDTYFYDIKFIQLKENSYNSQKFCTLKITRCTVDVILIMVGNGLKEFTQPPTVSRLNASVC